MRRRGGRVKTVLLVPAAALILTVPVWAATGPIGSSRYATYRGLGPQEWATLYTREHRAKLRLVRRHERIQRNLRTQLGLARAAARRERTRRTPPIGSHWLERAFLCIHSGEGSWTDPSPPYWGGLQMDLSFQRTYGLEFMEAWGTADRWPMSVQMAVAIRAYLSGRRFAPWPNTSRACGLR